MSKSRERVPGTHAAWRNAGLHTAQLDSGAWVKFRYPDLSMLYAAGKIPEALRPVAQLRIANQLKFLDGPLPEPGQPDERALKDKELAESYRLNLWLLAEMIDQVATDLDDVDEHGIPKTWEPARFELDEVEEIVPAEDRTMLSELAARDRDTDARGVVMGVMPLSRLARFREAHGCKPDCEACEGLRREGSGFVRRLLQV